MRLKIMNGLDFLLEFGRVQDDAFYDVMMTGASDFKVLMSDNEVFHFTLRKIDNKNILMALYSIDKGKSKKLSEETVELGKYINKGPFTTDDLYFGLRDVANEFGRLLNNFVYPQKKEIIRIDY